MPDAVDARLLLLKMARRAGLDAATAERIFEGAPLDFPVFFSSSLPLLAHRLGMIGITLFGRVHLCSAACGLPPEELIVLLRHEAEHVRQQREHGAAFYPRYLYDWIRGLIGASSPSTLPRWRRAYLAIRDEREARAAGERARRLLNRK